MTNYLTNDTDLTTVADAIRTKGGTSAALAFPQGFADAIEAIPSGGGDSGLTDWAEGRSFTLRCSASFVASSAFQSAFYAIPANVVSMYFPDCLSIASYAFWKCTKLTAATFPACTMIGYAAFSSCTSLSNVSFPECTEVSRSAFYACTSLESFAAPKCTSVGTSAFYACNKLKAASFPRCPQIGTQTFRNCYELEELTIGTQLGNVVSLTNSDAFQGCSALRSIYVPASLVSSYQAASKWSYFASMFVGV